MENKTLDNNSINKKATMEVNNNKFLYIIPLLNIIFPILSVEGLVPWAVAVYFCYKGIKAIATTNKPLKKSITYLVMSGFIVLLYNFIVYFVSNYLVKLLM
ncbi:hypothetical protein [Clostridium manihotivorum]|uniref:Uncharacterized protein n=1 Tax=Clostridium manihotivorum TaxID=2320868 RepID=A0A410DSC3_9CLOT|nr:hypothetical protein [Clostridium manihotivorum]QAA31948.1 hypothetical protein C1I91_09950 [Clostridium manihotivorum]